MSCILTVVAWNKHLRTGPAWLLALSASCATPPAREGTGTLVVAADDGAQLWRGPATYVLRPPARVVSLPGLGELQVTDVGSRLVWAKEGLARLEVLEGGDGCRAVEVRRLCCAGARFAGLVEGRPRVLVVDGCADENDLLESRLGAVHEATVGPVPWRRRCAPVPPRAPGCEVSYLALRSVEHDDNVDVVAGFSFSWDGERFAACFIERDAGRYRVQLAVEDSCGAAGAVTLAGDSGELD